MTSLNWIRRRHYRLFSLSHIALAIVMIFFAVLHFYWIGLYLLPGVFYYLACSLPVQLKQEGLHVSQTSIIPHSNGCFEVALIVAGKAPSQLHYPAYIRICVPEIDRWTWHPFTLAQPIE